MLLAATCGPATRSRTPWIVFGIDGADWSVIDAMWENGELPRLKALADRGVRATLKTAYGKSPVIWTSIATGVSAERHGIIDFVIPTENGDIPLSSRQRKVPAIWNVMTWLDRPVAVFGWWATWPVEQVSGVMVSDRFGRNLDDEVFPSDAAVQIDRAPVARLWERRLGDALRAVGEVAAQAGKEPLDERYEHDVTKVALTRSAVETGVYELVMGYVRTVDVVSHMHYGCWDRPPPTGSGCEPDMVRTAYSIADDALGTILDGSPGAVNVLVLSDHGFHRLQPQYRVSMDFDRLLEHLGYLMRSADGRVDTESSKFVGFANPGHTRFKNVRRLPTATDRDEQRLLDQVLSLRYEGGDPVFSPTRRRGPTEDTIMVLRVSRDHPSHRVSGDGVADFKLVDRIVPLTGSHGGRNDGILIAAGPDIVSGRLERAHIFDIAPTLAYGLGLPVPEDSDGQARESIFTEAFRQAHPVETISSWGTRNQTEAATGSDADEQILEELRALGYLDG